MPSLCTVLVCGLPLTTVPHDGISEEKTNEVKRNSRARFAKPIHTHLSTLPRGNFLGHEASVIVDAGRIRAHGLRRWYAGGLQSRLLPPLRRRIFWQFLSLRNRLAGAAVS